jgi:hypothetical protein
MDNSGSESDSSSSSCSNNSGSSTFEPLDVTSLEAAIAADFFNPQHHINLIKALQKAGASQCEQLSAARERMAGSLALTTELWLQWIEDEIAVAASQQDISRIESLFERAVADSPSPEIYEAWTAFLERSIDSEEFDVTFVARARATHESALGSMGLNVGAGGKLWDAAIAFERKLLAKASPDAAAAASEARSKITALVKRRFSIPLDGMRTAASSLDMPLPPEVQPAYIVALNLLAARTRHEVQVRGGTAELWRAYAAWEESQGEPSRAHVVYERAVQALPYSESLWLAFAGFLCERKL